MGVIRASKVNTIMIALIMMVVIFCVDSQVQAAQIGDYTYTVTDGKAQITKYNGTGGAIIVPSTLGGAPVASIGVYAFEWCIGLTSITIPDSVLDIGYKAFDGCTHLAQINVDKDNPVYTSVDGILYDKSMKTLIKYPADNTFSTYTIPSSVTSISGGPWGGPHGGDVSNVFEGCKNLTSLTIPSSVTNIDKGTISGCSLLSQINVDKDNSFYSSINGVLFNKSAKELLQYPIGNEASSYTIPSSVTTIGGGAFRSCTSITSVTIPNSVSSVGDDILAGWGYGAFDGCTKLNYISIPSSVTSIGLYAFRQCAGLTGITFNSATTKIYEDAETIPTATKIIGYNPSTAKDYAIKYNRKFEVIGTAVAAPTPTLITVKVNGTQVVFDQPPVIIDNRTLVPLRAIFEALGALVNWDGDTQTVTATKGNTTIIVKIGSTQVTVNGEVKTLDVPAQIIMDRTLVPVRFISESLGAKVDWDEASQTVTINQ